jgi:hypothetical protein
MHEKVKEIKPKIVDVESAKRDYMTASIKNDSESMYQAKTYLEKNDKTTNKEDDSDISENDVDDDNGLE